MRCVWRLCPVAVFSVSVSPVGCPAPVPGVVAGLASVGGGSFFGLRPSRRSFSRWVAVVWFSSAGAAESFAGGACLPFFLSCGWPVWLPFFYIRKFCL